MKRVLAIKNEQSSARGIVSALSNEECFDLMLHDESDGLRIVFEQDWDIIIIEWNSLNLSAPEISRQIRVVKSTPIIILAYHQSSDDCIAGLESGADDYIREPFVKEELAARIKVILRRSGAVATDNQVFFNFKDIFVDESRKIVTKAGENISLSNREYDLLIFLIKNKNRVLTREMLLNKVWGYEMAVNPNVVDLYIGYLRKKFKSENKNTYIQTVHGRGYSMIE